MALNSNHFSTVPHLSQFCFGCEALGGTDWGHIDSPQIARAIRMAVELGVNFFDVADVYGLGLAEERLASILSENRHDLMIATKIGVAWTLPNTVNQRAKTTINNDPKYLDTALEASLGRLRLSQIPLCYLHWPEKDHSIFSKGVERFSHYRDKGIIRHIGLSNVDFAQLALASSITQIDFVQLPANILNCEIDPQILTYCQKNNITIVAYNVLASGLLTGKYGLNHHFEDNDRRSRLKNFKGKNLLENLNRIEKLKKRAQKQELPLSSYSIKTLLQKYKQTKLHIITGIKNSHQLYENFTAISCEK